MNRKAFTLIELLVVVAIIGILAAVGVVAYNGYTGAAKASVAKSNFSAFKKLINAYLFFCTRRIPIISNHTHRSQNADDGDDD